MIMFIMGAIFIGAGMSLLSYIYCWQEVRDGEPHILALRQITGIMDRHELNRLYGMPDEEFYYTLEPQQTQQLVKQYRLFFLAECAAEALCMLGVWRYMTGNADMRYLWLFMVLAVTCQAINFLYSMWLIRKWKDQLQEEVESGDE